MGTNFAFNVLATVQTVIGTQDFEYLEYLGRTTNSIGLDVSSYAAAVPLKGSVQPVDRAKYEEMGLDFTKNYFSILCLQDVKDLERTKAPDQIIFDSVTYEVMGESDWTVPAGWNRVLVIEI